MTLPALTVSHLAAAPFDVARLGDQPVVMTRGFESVSYGQLHFRHARPASGKITGRPVLCLHQTPNSSQVFIEFMAELAQDREVYALDTPGLGESDLPAQAPEIADYAGAVSEFLTARRLPRVDVVGYHTGASIAAELSRHEPEQVHRLVLVGLALLNDEERQAFFDQPWPRPQAADGSHLKEEWQRSQSWRGAGQSDASVTRTFLQKINAGNTGWWGARAVMRHNLGKTLTQTKVPFAVLNPNDDLHNVTPRVRDLRPDVAVVPIAGYGFGLFEVIPGPLAAFSRNYFDEGAVAPGVLHEGENDDP